MDTDDRLPSSPSELERWFQDHQTAAQRFLPGLLDLPGPDLSRELAQRPELQPGVSQLLLALVNATADRHPARAHELTSAVLDSLTANPSFPNAPLAPCLRGQAWTAHAGALRGTGRHMEALAAIAAAYDALQMPYNALWHIAAAEVVEAQILHDMGEREDALRLIGRAAEVIFDHGAVDRYVRVRMQEAGMHREGGDLDAAADVWRTMADRAVQRRNPVLAALLQSAAAGLLLRDGSPGAAASLFEGAYGALESAGLTREAIQARQGVAEAAVELGRLHDAVSEYYKVQALLLAAGDAVEAAAISVELVELLLMAGRRGEIETLANRAGSTFVDAGQENARHVWMLVRELSRARALTGEAIDRFRRFFRDLPLRPNAPFE